MGIHVRCSNGHHLNVKEAYAGKKGRCPHCKVVVNVPEKIDPVTDDDILELLMAGGGPQPGKTLSHGGDTGSIHDEPHRSDSKTDSISLVGLSAVKHNKTCSECGYRDPHWHASCSRCGHAYPGH